MNETLLSMQPLEELAQDQVEVIVKEIPTDKEIYIEEILWNSVTSVVSVDKFKNFGVKSVKQLSDADSKPTCAACIFIATANVTVVRHIAGKIVFCPRRSLICERMLEKEGVFGAVSIHELNLSLIEAGENLVTLELPLFFRQTCIDKVVTPYYQVAQAIVALHVLNGVIKKNCGIGPTARIVYDMAYRMMRDCGEELVQSSLLQNKKSHRIGKLVILERSMDMLTPLLQANSFEGLLDHFIGVRMGKFNSITINEPPISASSLGPLYNTIRTLSFEEAAKEVTIEVGRASGTYSADAFPPLVEVFETTAKLPKAYHQLKNVARLLKQVWLCRNDKSQHDYLRIQNLIVENAASTSASASASTQQTNKAETKREKENPSVIAFIEDLMHRRGSSTQTLSLMCLMSQLRGGLTETVWQNLKTIYIMTYGFEHLLTFSRLEDIGMYNRFGDPKARHVKYNGSLLVKALENAFVGNAIDKGINVHMGGEVRREKFDVQHELSDFSSYTRRKSLHRKRNINRGSSSGSGSDDDMGELSHSTTAADEAVVIVVLGGITIEELQGMRTQAAIHKRKLLVCTTNTITTNGLLHEFMTPRKPCA
eukprot:CFRG1103T1